MKRRVTQMKEKSKPPSRIKYESSHPTVSFRIDRELYARLTEVRKEGNSLSDILKIALGVLEPKKNQITQARKESYQLGYKEGYQKAELLYKIIYPCSVCKQSIALSSDKEKQAVAQYMKEKGWGHSNCVNPKSK